MDLMKLKDILRIAKSDYKLFNYYTGEELKEESILFSPYLEEYVVSIKTKNKVNEYLGSLHIDSYLEIYLLIGGEKNEQN